MLANYLKVALRSLVRHRLYAAINVAGLAVGMACCLLIYPAGLPGNRYWY